MALEHARRGPAGRFPVLAVLRHVEFARFALCRLLTTLSWQMLAVAVGWQVYALTHDPLALGIVGLSEFRAVRVPG